MTFQFQNYSTLQCTFRRM